MSVYYLDTSALIKRYVAETGRLWVWRQQWLSIVTLLVDDYTPLIFVSADDRLNRSAVSERLVVDNPNSHP